MTRGIYKESSGFLHRCKGTTARRRRSLPQYEPLLRPLLAVAAAMPALHDHYGVGFANALGAFGATLCEVGRRWVVWSQ